MPLSLIRRCRRVRRGCFRLSIGFYNAFSAVVTETAFFWQFGVAMRTVDFAVETFSAEITESYAVGQFVTTIFTKHIYTSKAIFCRRKICGKLN
jgi:hypothetical protein